MLIKLVETGRGDLLRRAAEEFSILAGSDSSVKQLLVEESAILPIVFCCRTSDAVTQQHSLEALSSLAESSDIRPRVARCISGTIAKLAEQATSAYVSISISRLLNNLVQDEDATRTKVVREGGIDVLFGLISRCNHPHVQVLTAVALARVSTLAQAKDSIATPRGFGVLAAFAASSEGSTRSSAARVLRDVCHSDRPLPPNMRAQALPIAAKLIGYASDGLSQMALEALGYLAGQGDIAKETRVWLQIEGLITGIVGACGPLMNHRTVEIALPILSTLTTSSVGAEAAITAGAINILVSAVSRQHRDVKVFSICCLANMAAHEHLRPKLEICVPGLQEVAAKTESGVAKKEAAYVLSLLEKPVDVDVEVQSVVDESWVAVHAELDQAIKDGSVVLSVNIAQTTAGAVGIPASMNSSTRRGELGLLDSGAGLLDSRVVVPSSGTSSVMMTEEEHLVETDGTYNQVSWSTVEATEEEVVVVGEEEALNWEVVDVPKAIDFKEIVGAGSYAEVYRGVWKHDDVAVKRFHSKNMNEKELKQFMAELNMLASLNHEHIVKFLAGSAKAPNFCIITEFIYPGNLQVVLKKQSEYKLDWDERVQMALDVARGVDYLHTFKSPIIHRDLKSSNLLVTQDMRVKVGDFGASRHIIPSGLMSCCGTPVYMAPEVLRGEKYDEQADIYSFGIVMWEIMTRSVPFEGIIPVVAGMKIAYENARPAIPHTVQSPEYLALMRACWDPKSEERPASGTTVTGLEHLHRQAYGAVEERASFA